jgi:hypothetical protein
MANIARNATFIAIFAIDALALGTVVMLLVR